MLSQDQINTGIQTGVNFYNKLSSTTGNLPSLAGLGSYACQIGAELDPDLSGPLGFVESGFQFAVAGGTIGSIVPGFGTVIGAAVGAVLGILKHIFPGGSPDNNPYDYMNDYQRAAAQVPIPPLPCIEPSGTDQTQHIEAYVSCATTLHDRMPCIQVSSDPKCDWFWIGTNPWQATVQERSQFAIYAGDTNAMNEWARRSIRWGIADYLSAAGASGSPFAADQGEDGGLGDPFASLSSKLSVMAAMHTKANFENPGVGFPDRLGDRDALQYLLTWYWTRKTSGGPDSPTAAWFISRLQSLVHGSTTSVTHANFVAPRGVRGIGTQIYGRPSAKHFAAGALAGAAILLGAKHGFLGDKARSLVTRR